MPSRSRVVRDRLARGGQEVVADVVAELAGRTDDRPVVADRAHDRHGDVDGESPPARRPTVAVDRDGGVRAGEVADGRPVSTHGPTPVSVEWVSTTVAPPEREQGGQAGGHVEVEGVLRVAGEVRGARGVARLGEAAAVDGPVDESRVGAVPAVVPGIDGDDFAHQGRDVDRAPRNGAPPKA